MSHINQPHSKKFKYTPLLDGHFRLLKILPSKGDYDHEVECCTSVHLLNEKSSPSYVALSYTWGSVDGGTITLDGKPFEVGFNLQDSLKALRYHNLGESIWIDAICINQGDLGERQVQVARMNEVYTFASSVAICLTPDPGEEETGIIHEFYETLADFKKHWQKGQLTVFPQDRVRMHGAVNWLAEKSYFGRLWIVQENVLARKRILVCRRHKAPWLHVRFIVGEAVARPPGDVDQTVFHNKVLSSGLEKISRVDANKRAPGELQSTGISGIRASSTPAEVLWWTMNFYRGQKCKDSRDRVYGMLGLPQLQQEAVRSSLKPDYTVSKVDLLVYLVSWLEMNGTINPVGIRRHSPLVHWGFLQEILEADIGDGLSEQPTTSGISDEATKSQLVLKAAWDDIKAKSYTLPAYYQATIEATTEMVDIEMILSNVADSDMDKKTREQQVKILHHIGKFQPGNPVRKVEKAGQPKAVNTSSRQAVAQSKDITKPTSWAQIECTTGVLGYANPATRPGDIIVNLTCDYTPNNTGVSTSVVIREESDKVFKLIGLAVSVEALVACKHTSDAAQMVQRMPARRVPLSEQQREKQQRFRDLHVEIEALSAAQIVSPNNCRTSESTWRPRVESKQGKTKA